jgi:hypothetical protein
MPSIYQLLPPLGAPAFLDHRARPIDVDLHDPQLWRQHRWSAFATGSAARIDAVSAERRQRFLEAALARARAFHGALHRRPETACPVRVIALGGDCLPTLARAVLPERSHQLPRFEPVNAAESAEMFDAGDGRVTRGSVLAAYQDTGEDDAFCGIPEVAQCFFGSADHHGIYAEPTFQNILLRLLLRPTRLPVSGTTAEPLPSAG